MKKFQHLNVLTEHIDDAFQSFYDTMLNDIKLAVFFESQEQVERLIQKQKAQFLASISMDAEALKQMYIKLGEYHYDLLIPYIDFIKGTEILERHFLLSSQKHPDATILMNDIFDYFKIMKSFTAKGYLNRMLKEDRRDIESFFEQTSQNEDMYLPKALVFEKISWLKELLYSIKHNTEFALNTEESLLKTWLQETKYLTLEKKQFFEELEDRINLNTQNLFYFLKREDYLEILPLYTSLLSVYKLTLMMNNAITIEYANKIISNMKLDSLTQLFRKDIFEEILKKEMALVKREKDYCISIAYIDLDNFKAVNDNFGHYSGDKVIEQMGEIIRHNIRASDIGFRIGGDEFAIIFKNANMQQASKVCKKIKADFSSFEFIFNDEITFSVSVSIGISDLSHHEEMNLKALLESVDKKLYCAKHRGKNQICL